MAQFESTIDEEDSIDRARDVYEQAYKTLRTANDKEERLMLVENWLDFEVNIFKILMHFFIEKFSFVFQREKGTDASVTRVEKFLPKRLRQKRKILTEDGVRSFIIDFLSDQTKKRKCFFFQSDSGQWEEFMQLVFPDDEATQPHLKLLALAKRWKKGQEENETSAAPAPAVDSEPEIAPGPVAPMSSTDDEDTEPLPESRIDDEEMNDES